MKFLLNMNLPRELGRYLKTKGHESRHAGDAGMYKSTDLEIIEQAKINDEIILTHDLDYGNLLAFSKEQKPSVIIFRVRNTKPENLFISFINALPEIEQSLLNGAVVIIEDAAVRIRKLPII